MFCFEGCLKSEVCLLYFLNFIPEDEQKIKIVEISVVSFSKISELGKVFQPGKTLLKNFPKYFEKANIPKKFSA